jgi:hypothetical protein
MNNSLKINNSELKMNENLIVSLNQNYKLVLNFYRKIIMALKVFQLLLNLHRKI